ncbi:hypothetical protein ACHWQZ_G008681 [Mnemiopsis leidyi]
MAARQIVLNCRHFLNNCSEISVKVPWGQVKGIEIGPKDAPPVLMVHGWLDNCYSFVPLLTMLPKNRRYIALDLPGHGHSSHKPTGCYNLILNAVVDLEHIRRNLNLEKFTFIGHSMSGILGILYSSTYPEHIDRTVVLDSLFPFVKESSEVVTNLRKASDDLVIDAFRCKTYKDVNTLAAAKSLSTWYIGLDAALCQLIVERNTVPCEGGIRQLYDPKLRYSSLVYLTKEQYMEFLKAQQKPVLYLEGDRGVTSILPSLKGLYEIAKSAVSNNLITSEVIEGPHHFHMENPDATALSISRFMDS